MATLDDPVRLLAAWETAAAVPGVARGPVLLHQAGMVDDLDAALDLPVGVTAALTATLHRATFGDTVDAVLGCACGAALEVSLPLDAVAAVPAGSAVTVTGPDATLRVHSPTTRDLLAAGQAADPAGALLARCVRDDTGAPVEPDRLPPEQRRAVDAAAEHLAGAAALVLRADCPECGAPVAAPLDVTALLWERIAARAPVVLAEVATLAAAFGWSEADVLALPATRRQAYLALARGGGV